MRGAEPVGLQRVCGHSVDLWTAFDFPRGPDAAQCGIANANSCAHTNTVAHIAKGHDTNVDLQA